MSICKTQLKPKKLNSKIYRNKYTKNAHQLSYNYRRKETKFYKNMWNFMNR